MRCGYSLRRKPHLFFVFVFYLNSHSNLECGHIDKKDRFADLGKSSHNKRFVFTWTITPPFATFSHTLNLCITPKSIKNEQTTTKKKMTIFLTSRKWSIPCRSDKRKKTSVMT